LDLFLENFFLTKIFQKREKIETIFFVDIYHKQNLPFRDSIPINHETIRKISLFLKNIEKKYLEDLSGF